MNYNYITIGQDCSPAGALKNLDLRKFSLPFDWIVSDVNKVIECINEDFINFHKNLRINSLNTRVIDYYGFEFPHDYPNIESNNIDNIGEGVFGENKILDGWENFIEINLEKYSRRIKRFNDILTSNIDIIVLYRGNVENVSLFQKLFIDKYKKSNIKFVVATNTLYEDSNIITCNPEINGEWNDCDIWNQSIKKFIK